MARDRKPALREPLFWAYGLRDAVDLDAYSHLGLNTVYIDVSMAPDGTHVAVGQFIRAAAARGLHVIVGIPTALGRERGDERDPASAYSERYLSAVDQLVQAVVRAYRDEPAVIAWATGHHPAAHMTYSDADFRRHLQERYSSVAELSAAWDSQFISFDSVRMVDAEQDASQPFAIGRRSLAVAEYQRAAFAALHRRWLRSIRQYDDSRPIFTGRLHLYRSLVSVPTEYGCVVADATGLPVRADLQTQAAERIAIARHGGLCDAIACLRLPSGLRLPSARPEIPSEDPQLRALQHLHRGSLDAPRLHALRTWLTLAGLQGSRGIAFSSWERLRDETVELREAVRDFLTDPAGNRLFTTRPQASAAILYEPYLPVVSQRGLGFYGYLNVPGEVETALLLSMCRLPSAYGTVDVCGVEDLEKLDLARYGVILAPRAFNLPETAQEALERYVHGGGALLADLGVGLSQAGSWLALPARMMALFGIEEIVRLQNTYRGGWQAGNGVVGMRTAEFPSLSAGAQTSGTAEWQGGKAAFHGWNVMVAPAWETATVLAMDAEVRGQGTKPGRRSRPRRRGRAANPKQPVAGLSGGILLSRHGKGMALYATTRLWETWPASDPLYRAFHNDLLARRANIMLQTGEGLYPRSVLAGTCEGGIWAYNTSTVSADVPILAANARSRVYLGAVARSVAAFRRPGGMPAGAELLSVRASAGTVTHVDATSVTVEPLTDRITTIGRSYGPARVEFDVAGSDARPSCCAAGGMHRAGTISSGDFDLHGRRGGGGGRAVEAATAGSGARPLPGARGPAIHWPSPGPRPRLGWPCTRHALSAAAAQGPQRRPGAPAGRHPCPARCR